MRAAVEGAARARPRFHVDKYSSAHVYVRLAAHLTLDTLPADLVQDSAQLVKANSIEGIHS